ncbi:hypothetical protein Pelo_5409 [Pelomyxa schiedti]|nr:hypothetical protein Pelo_5409 [Pelomyxa schiedti]
MLPGASCVQCHSRICTYAVCCLGVRIASNSSGPSCTASNLSKILVPPSIWVVQGFSLLVQVLNTTDVRSFHENTPHYCVPKIVPHNPKGSAIPVEKWET